MAPNTLGHLSENNEDLLKSCEERNYMGMHVRGRLRGHGSEGIRGVRILCLVEQMFAFCDVRYYFSVAF